MKPMSTLLAKSLVRFLPSSKKETLDVPLRACVHYCGFRYANQEYNPYEGYQIDLHRGVPLLEVRRRFIDFLRFYRPRHFGEALGLQFRRRYALWVYPWQDCDPRDWQRHGWRESPDECPDLLTHFCDKGIPTVRIDEEFVWLEKSLRSIAVQGYQPDTYEPAQVLELRRIDGSAAYLLLDGNHRAGSLVAIGCSDTIVANCESTIYEAEVDAWPAVRRGWMSREDALALFLAYFRGEPSWQRSDTPAHIIGPSDWHKQYLLVK